MSDNDQQQPQGDTFYLGLTLAGAVSAGAYSAGVLDFLREALDAWEAAKRNGDQVPGHKVQIQAISGTSAGAMCAAMFVGTLRAMPNTTPNPYPLPPIGTGQLYDAWVENVDIEPMLDDDDLLEGGEVKSLLNCRILDRIARDVLPPTAGAQFALPSWVSNDAEVFLCTTTLQGIPYHLQPFGNTGTSYAMNLHSGLMKFRLLDAAPATAPSDAVALHPGAGDECWEALRNSALASGAFPFALQARLTHSTIDMLKERRWEIPDISCSRLSRPREILPSLGDLKDFATVCVDGGVINNEPVEHVRMALRQKLAANSLPRQLDLAQAATLLIDPFPDTEQAPPDTNHRQGIFEVLKKLIPAMLDQLRFKTDELLLAAKVGVGSRYMIAPNRPPIPANDPPPRQNLACGALGGFIGFIDRAFRHHDYLLGRLNCQRFLLRHFYMDGANPVFSGNPAAYTGNAYFAGNGDYAAILAEVTAANAAAAASGDPGVLAGASRFTPVPVIPLMPQLRSLQAAIGTPALTWPHYDRARLDKLQRRIENRMDAVLERLLSGLDFALRALFLSKIARLLRIHPAVKIAEAARRKIAAALKDAAL